MKIYKRIALLLMMVATCFVAYSSGQTDMEEGEFKFSVMLPLTGNIAFLGEPVTTGVDLALHEINSAGGINGKKMRVVYGDTKGDSKLAVTVFRQLLLSENIKVFMPFLSGETMAIQPIATDEGVLVMSLTVHEPAASKDLNTFRLSYSFQAEAELMAEYLLSHNVKSLICIHSEDATSKFQVEESFVPKLKNKGFDNIYTEPFKVGQKDFRSLVARVKAQNPSDIYIVGFGSDFPNILKELKLQNLLPPNVRVTGGVPMWEVSHFVEPDMLEGIIFASPPLFINNQDARIQTVIDTPEEFKDRSSNFLTFYAYDNVMLLADALRKTKEMDPAKIKDYVFGLREYKGISGTMRIRENGSASPKLVLFKWEGGEMKLIE